MPKTKSFRSWGWTSILQEKPKWEMGYGTLTDWVQWVISFRPFKMETLNI